MRAVDTNVLVRLLVRDDAEQVEAAEAFIANGAWVPLLALAETTWVLSSVYDCAPAAVATAVEMLLNHEHLALQDADAVAQAVDQFRRKRSLEFSDCLMLAVSRKTGHVPLGTFDRARGRLEGAQRV
ncbi:MAG: type II toxin-antitoxin system VapC family toxin [Acidobacteria bacterium]|nr:type II toxin-antitoxin system VapC family toxin [Acidobacteriota bacterium]